MPRPRMYPEDFHPWYKDPILWVIRTVHTLKNINFKDHPENRELVIDWAKCGVYKAKLIGDGSKPEIACGRCISVCPFSKISE